MIEYKDIVEDMQTDKNKNGWSLSKVFNYLREKESLKKLRDITLFEVIIKDFGKMGRIFSRREISSNFKNLVSEHEYKPEFLRENVDCILVQNGMYYDEYLRTERVKKKPSK